MASLESTERPTFRLPPSATLAVVCAGVFLASLDQTSVVTALPAVMVDLGVSIDRLNDLAWVVTAYLLGFTVAMPLLGRAGDVYGYRRLYLGAMLLFGAGSTAVALAPDLGWLIAARVVQAVGGGALVPAAIALAGEDLPPARRAIVFGIVGAAAEAGGVLGPLYGGLIVDWIGWRWVFWSNLPVVGVLAVALLGMREAGRSGGRLDVTGGVLLAGGLSLLTGGLAQRSLFGGGSALPYVLIGVGVLLLAALPFAERRALAPIVSMALFRARSFAAAMSAQLLAGGALVLILVTVPLMTDTVLGEPPLEGGLRLMRFTGAIPFGALLGGYAASRIGVAHRRPYASAGGTGARGGLLRAAYYVGRDDSGATAHTAPGRRRARFRFAHRAIHCGRGGGRRQRVPRDRCRVDNGVAHVRDDRGARRDVRARGRLPAIARGRSAGAHTTPRRECGGVLGARRRLRGGHLQRVVRRLPALLPVWVGAGRARRRAVAVDARRPARLVLAAERLPEEAVLTQQPRRS